MVWIATYPWMRIDQSQMLDPGPRKTTHAVLQGEIGSSRPVSLKDGASGKTRRNILVKKGASPKPATRTLTLIACQSGVIRCLYGRNIPITCEDRQSYHSFLPGKTIVSPLWQAGLKTVIKALLKPIQKEVGVTKMALDNVIKIADVDFEFIVICAARAEHERKVSERTSHQNEKSEEKKASQQSDRAGGSPEGI
ncbi:uncharacterized protein BCR38DRAFT_413527 [Pseudomassariella vexata]|uniref:Uncharacterized protein n=1 Tax=Pseudomassariella vexata TaxID=1141098 RepID=A0A1Y2DFX3_9PEZI|nr:uncharacterized protein BCR38DRAFT_413527 [Pseudomassariella vexata]ORY58119.1 hypothetical protein BCR38DRAFT_413527 [Pseudomassariella vexata]